jgi:hypothetical protein
VIENTDSYVCGLADVPLLGITIGRSLDQAAELWANREALVSPSHGVRWSWKELAERVDALAAGFIALGLERGGDFPHDIGARDALTVDDAAKATIPGRRRSEWIMQICAIS